MKKDEIYLPRGWSLGGRCKASLFRELTDAACLGLGE